MADFTTWQRHNLERLAQDLTNRVIQEEKQAMTTARRLQMALQAVERTRQELNILDADQNCGANTNGVRSSLCEIEMEVRSAMRSLPQAKEDPITRRSRIACENGESAVPRG